MSSRRGWTSRETRDPTGTWEAGVAVRAVTAVGSERAADAIRNARAQRPSANQRPRRAKQLPSPSPRPRARRPAGSKPPYHVAPPHVEAMAVHHGAVAAPLLGYAEPIAGLRRHLGGGDGPCLRARVPAAPPRPGHLLRTGSAEGPNGGTARPGRRRARTWGRRESPSRVAPVFLTAGGRLRCHLPRGARAWPGCLEPQEAEGSRCLSPSGAACRLSTLDTCHAVA